MISPCSELELLELRVAIRERVRPDKWRDLLRRVTNRQSYIDLFKCLQVQKSDTKVKFIRCFCLFASIVNMLLVLFLLQLRNFYSNPAPQQVKKLQQLEDALSFEGLNLPLIFVIFAVSILKIFPSIRRHCSFSVDCV